MRFLISMFALASAALASSVVAQQTPAAPAAAAVTLPSITLMPEFDRVLRDYEAAWSKGDASALSELFAMDGFVMQNGKPPVRGRAAIRAAYQGSSGGNLKLRALAVETSGNVGYIIGAYGYDAAATDMGKFTLTLKRDASGKWLIFSDMDNGNRAMRPGG